VRRWAVILIAVSTMGAAGGAGWFFRQDIGMWWHHAFTPVAMGGAPRPVPDARSYAVLTEELLRWREELADRYSKAKTSAERQAVEHDARMVLEEALPAMMRCWLGTPWDFHGTADGPGEGKIACGYFVATVLRDAGFKVDRYKLAQQPSGNILRTFLKKEDCVLTVGVEYNSFADSLSQVTPGIYVVGLDTHVAFLVVERDGFRFIHSSGSAPWCVVDEGRDDASVLQKSNWRMLGNFSGDAGVVQMWLKGGKIPVKGA
jgi:hypothetical protein